MNDSFKKIVAFYRKFGSDKSFSSISDVSFEIRIDKNSSDEILNLNNYIKSVFDQNIVEFITIDNTSIGPSDYQTLHIYEGKKAAFTFESVSINGSFLYSFDDLLSTFKAEQPNIFYIAEIDYASFDETEPEKIKTYKAIIDLIDTLRDDANKICDHSINNETTDTFKLIFLGESKLELETNYSTTELSVSAELIKAFIDDVKTDSGEIRTHHKERNQILKKSLFDLLKHLDKNSEKFPYLIHHIDELRKNYNSGLDLYLNEFSFSKFSDELSEKKISYIEKTNKVVSDIGLKLLLIPVIGIAAKFSDTSDKGYLTFSTALYSALMMLLIIYTIDSISQISTEIKNTFQYRKYRKSILTSGSIEEELSKAHTQLNLRLTCIKLVLFLFYIFLLALALYSWKGEAFLNNFNNAFFTIEGRYSSAANLLAFFSAGLAIYLIARFPVFIYRNRKK